MKRLAFVTMVAISLTLGCGGGGRADVTAGPMPQGGSYTGVWHSPQYGEMHFIQQGNSLVGRYERDERRGRIQGTVQGDLMRFEWTERRELVVGRPQVTRGRGYFRYTIGTDDRHNILGEWGIDDNEQGGGEWNAYRLRNRNPQVDPTGSGGEDDDGEELEELDDGEGGSDDAPSGGSGASGDDDLGGDDDLDGLAL